jgi:nitroreductase
VIDMRTLVRRRRSCRNYQDKSLTRLQIEALLEDAVWVPSGSNNQPWRFVVITDKGLLKKYSEAAKTDWLRTLDVNSHMRQYESSIRNPAYHIFYNAPALIIIYGNTESYWHVYDCSMVAYNLHLLAEEAGLGACWIGFAHNVFSAEDVKSELGVPQHYTLVAPVIIGFPADTDSNSTVPRKHFITEFVGTESVD